MTQEIKFMLSGICLLIMIFIFYRVWKNFKEFESFYNESMTQIKKEEKEKNETYK